MHPFGTQYHYAIPNTVMQPINHELASEHSLFHRNKSPSPPVSRHISLYTTTRPKPTKSVRNTFLNSQLRIKSPLTTPIKPPALNKHLTSNKTQTRSRHGKARTPADCNRATLATDILRALSAPRAINGGPLISASRLKATNLNLKSQLIPTSKVTSQNQNHSPHAIIQHSTTVPPIPPGNDHHR